MSQGGVSTSVRDIQYGIAAANISGTVGIHYHHPQTQPQTPPLPTHTIPFDRNTHFVNREDIFSQISIKCAGQASRVALVGLGGVGKSQLAIEYGHRTRLEHEDTWVLWCHASNTARLNSSLSEIASLVQAPGHESPQADYFKLVKNWLHDPRNRKWLLIIDNADDKAVISRQSSPSPSEPLRTLYQGSDGRVLITSRTKDAARELVEDDQMLEIDPMSPLESQRLLSDQLGLLRSSDEDVKALASALENMPLALIQAAAYIRRNAPNTSVKQYLELFNKNDQNKIDLLGKKAGHLNRDWDANSSILTTLMISFKDIRKASPSAADILYLMSFYDRQGIPEQLLQPKASYHRPRKSNVESRIAGTQGSQSVCLAESDKDDQLPEYEESGSSYTDDIAVERGRDMENSGDFKSDIEVLRDYAFIKMNIAGTFEMHALVQLAIGYWLKSLGDYDIWRDRSIDVLSEHWSETVQSDWAGREKLIAHIKMAIRNKPEAEDVLWGWAWLMSAAGTHEMNKNSLHDAMQFSTLSWSTKAGLMGKHDRSTLWSLYNIGMVVLEFVYRDDRDEQAEQRFLQDTQSLWQSASDVNCERKSWTVLFQVCEIAARIYIRNRKYADAETLLSGCISSSTEYFGPDSQETLGLQTKFAKLRREQGDVAMAEKMLSDISKKLMSIFEASQQHSNDWGREKLRSTVMNAMSAWARCLETQNNLEDAEVRYRDLLLWQQSGNSSPFNIMLTENSLIRCLAKQNRLEDAAQLLENSKKWQKAQLGQEYHTRETLGVLSYLARAYIKRNERKKAIPLFEKVLQYQREFYGNTTREVLNTMNNLALAYFDDEEYSKAMSIYEEYMASEEGRHRITHRGEWEVINHLGYCYYKLSKYDEAIKTLREHSHLMESTIFRNDSKGKIYALELLGHTYSQQEKHTEATTYYRKCLEQQRSLKGEKHEDTLGTMEWLSDTLYASGQYQEAITQLEECVQLSIELLGPEDTKTVEHKKLLKKWRSKVMKTHHKVAAEDCSASLSSHSHTLVESMDQMTIQQSEKPKSVSTKARKWISQKLKKR